MAERDFADHFSVGEALDVMDDGEMGVIDHPFAGFMHPETVVDILGSIENVLVEISDTVYERAAEKPARRDRVIDIGCVGEREILVDIMLVAAPFQYDRGDFPELVEYCGELSYRNLLGAVREKELRRPEGRSIRRF